MRVSYWARRDWADRLKPPVSLAAGPRHSIGDADLESMPIQEERAFLTLPSPPLSPYPGLL